MNRHELFKKRLNELGMYDKDSDYDGMIGEAVEELSRVFGEQGHSGMSATITVQLFNKLMDEYHYSDSKMWEGQEPHELPDSDASATYNSLTDAQKASMWYIIATQALYELDRPLLLDEEFANDTADGKKAIYSKVTDDGHTYKVI